MRVKIHEFFSTEGLTVEDTKGLNKSVRQLILEDLTKDQKRLN